ncbi:MAG: hypothetical protein DRH08_07850 [Deltaproteobacteria bacterium]|nr:MAG: hypothetical protein DRH08_07850 [Deltaproteobacteria bacterium]
MKTIIICSQGSIKPKDAVITDNAESFGCEACEYIYNNVIHRCNKFISLAGQDPQTGVTLNDIHKCADTWAPILQTEMSGTNRGQTDAIVSLRNETVKRQDKMLHIIKRPVMPRLIEDKQ